MLERSARLAFAPLAVFAPLLVLSATGCCQRKTSSSTPVLATPRPFEPGSWSKGPKTFGVTYTSNRCRLELDVFPREPRGSLTPRNCDEVSFEVAGQRWTELGDGGTSHYFGLASSYGSLRPGVAGDFALALPIVAARGATPAVTLPAPTIHLGADLTEAIASNILHASTLPLVFEGEAPAAAGAKARTAYIVWHAHAGKLVGPGQTLADVDYVAKSQSVPSGEKRCSGYARYAGGPGASSVTFPVEDLQVELKDRRTGESVATQLFPANKTCPRFVVGPRESLRPDAQPIVQWVEKYLAGGKAGSGGAPAGSRRGK